MNNHQKPRCHMQQSTCYEQGSVLIIGLVLLVGITLLSVSGMQSVVLNQQMAVNTFEVERDYQLAESAGKFATQQAAWVQSAFNDQATNPAINAPATNHPINHITASDPNPTTVESGLLVKPFAPLNQSMGEGNGFGSWIVEAHGKAGDGAGKTIIQGFLVTGAEGS
jgi:Tfp pilus assembly protein PilX